MLEKTLKNLCENANSCAKFVLAHLVELALFFLKREEKGVLWASPECPLQE